MRELGGTHRHRHPAIACAAHSGRQHTGAVNTYASTTSKAHARPVPQAPPARCTHSPSRVRRVLCILPEVRRLVTKEGERIHRLCGAEERATLRKRRGAVKHILARREIIVHGVAHIRLCDLREVHRQTSALLDSCKDGRHHYGVNGIVHEPSHHGSVSRRRGHVALPHRHHTPLCPFAMLRVGAPSELARASRHRITLRNTQTDAEHLLCACKPGTRC